MTLFNITNVIGSAAIGSGGVSMATGLYPGADIVLAVGITLTVMSWLALARMRYLAKVFGEAADTN